MMLVRITKKKEKKEKEKKEKKNEIKKIKKKNLPSPGFHLSVIKFQNYVSPTRVIKPG